MLDFKAAKTICESPESAIGNGVTVNELIYEVIGVLEEIGSMSYSSNSSYISKNTKEDMNADTPISSIDVYIKAGEDQDKVFENIKSNLCKIMLI